MTTLTQQRPDQPSPPPPAPTLPLDERGGPDWAALLSKLGPLIGLIFVVVLFSALRYHTFFTLGNFELILRQTAVVGIAALGMTLIPPTGRSRR